MRITKLLIATFSGLFIFNTTAAWGPTGHRIVGEIGQRHLDPNARKAVEAIIGDNSLAKLATWPDEIRSDDNWKFMQTLHFMSVDDDEKLHEVLSRTKGKDFPTNVVEAITFFTDILKGNAGKTKVFEDAMKAHKAKPLFDSTKAAALSFLIHFVGDVHQPLHVGRTYDLGGNKIEVLWFGEHKKLHGVWDSDIIDSENLSFTEYSTFINHPSDSEIKQWQASKITDWAQESIDVRKSLYASTYKNTDRDSNLPALSYDYAHENGPLVKERLLQGGIRLAGTLNDIF